MDTHQEFLFKPLCIERGWTSEVCFDADDKENGAASTERQESIVPFCGAKGWFKIFSSNYGAVRQLKLFVQWTAKENYGSIY